MKTLKFLIPLLIFAAIGVFLFKGLYKDPSKVPSPLIDRAVPAFSLPVLADGEATGKNWAPDAMRGKVWLLNVWGSWCVACVAEHPLLNALSEQRVLPIVGLAWKDQPRNSLAWLKKHGDPYAVVISDLVGNAAIDLGVYGAPESFLVDKAGNIRFKQIGPFDAQTITDTLLPLIRQLEAESH